MDLNAELASDCSRRQQNASRGNKGASADRLRADRKAAMALPVVNFDPRDRQAGTIHSMSPIRNKNRVYSREVRFWQTQCHREQPFDKTLL